MSQRSYPAPLSILVDLVHCTESTTNRVATLIRDHYSRLSHISLLLPEGKSGILDLIECRTSTIESIYLSYSLSLPNWIAALYD